MESCKTCRFSGKAKEMYLDLDDPMPDTRLPSKKERDILQCRYNPPVVFVSRDIEGGEGYLATLFPRINETLWCGKFENKK